MSLQISIRNVQATDPLALVKTTSVDCTLSASRCSTLRSVCFALFIQVLPPSPLPPAGQ